VAPCTRCRCAACKDFCAAQPPLRVLRLGSEWNGAALQKEAVPDYLSFRLRKEWDTSKGSEYHTLARVSPRHARELTYLFVAVYHAYDDATETAEKLPVLNLPLISLKVLHIEHRAAGHTVPVGTPLRT
jgi:hypothetical protein